MYIPLLSFLLLSYSLLSSSLSPLALSLSFSLGRSLSPSPLFSTQGLVLSVPLPLAVNVPRAILLFPPWTPASCFWFGGFLSKFEQVLGLQFELLSLLLQLLSLQFFLTNTLLLKICKNKENTKMEMYQNDSKYINFSP